jgi:integrase/recombinase XerD
VTLAHLQRWADDLAASKLAPASRARMLAAVKALLKFAAQQGHIPHDAGSALRLPQAQSKLAARILDEAAVQRMLALETDPRNALVLRVLYAAALRVSELCGLRWSDVLPRGERACVLTVVGKGEKLRYVRLDGNVAHDLIAKRLSTDGPVFVSAKGGALSAQQVRRIVRAAARRAGIAGDISPHWLRHSSATHALNRGAPISLVQQLLGHASISTTGRYLHADPEKGLSGYLAV